MFDFGKYTGTSPPAGNYAFMVGGDKVLYVARADPTRNGRIDPAYLLLALAFDSGWSTPDIIASYRLPDAWFVAMKGMSFLANTLPGGFSFKLVEAKPGKQTEPMPSGPAMEVSLQGGNPPAGTVLANGDVFTPNAQGFHNIPRLYTMAALYYEYKKNASVAAMVVNAGGLVIALGHKSHGEGGCGHAEVRALFSIKGQVPDACLMVTTLRPCTMCAGLIQALFTNNGKQFWARPDPSNGADYENVENLSLDQGQALWSAYKDQRHVRNIKLANDLSFTDEFSDTWRDRGKLATPEAEQHKAAFNDWCTAFIVDGKEVAKSKAGLRVRVKTGVESALAKAKSCGGIQALSKRSDLFERMPSGKNAWVNGMDTAASEALVASYEANAKVKGVATAITKTKKEGDIGIIEFIGKAEGSKALRVASRNALAAKFAKYGKSAVDIKTATGVGNAAATSTKAPSDPRMQPLVDYLFNFVQTQI